jgi:hypothetical protein
MTLELVDLAAINDRIEYTCPMHPQIVRDQPGSCPICGMALEPRNVTVESSHPELGSMTRRFWISVTLMLPLAQLKDLLAFISSNLDYDGLRVSLGRDVAGEHSYGNHQEFDGGEGERIGRGYIVDEILQDAREAEAENNSAMGFR